MSEGIPVPANQYPVIESSGPSLLHTADRRERRAPGTLVLALGNPLRGDDGIGFEILAAIEEIPNLPHNITLYDGGLAGFDIALLIQGYQRVIIVDAAELHRLPGEWMRFNLDAASMAISHSTPRSMVHSAGLIEALQLSEALGIMPPEIVIYAVQPMEFGWAMGLSKPVGESIPEICADILTLLDESNDQSATSEVDRTVVGSPPDLNETKVKRT